MNIDQDYKNYFSFLDNYIEKAYSTAKKARMLNKDPEPHIDIPVAKDLAARVEGLVSIIHPNLMNSGLAKGIRILEKQYSKNDERVALKISEQTANNNFYKFETKQDSVDAGVRVGVAYLTLGVVTAPLEGIESIKLVNDQIHLYYAGPIRSAGGTAAAMSVMIADYLRIRLGLKEYKPTPDQVKRYGVELEDYSRMVGMQYDPKREETEFIIKHIKVCLTGSPTEKFEVSNFKDIEGVETPRVRGGMCLVVGEGLTLKAPKLTKRIKKFGKEFGLDQSWSWLIEYKKIQSRINAAKTPAQSSDDTSKSKYVPATKYMKKVIAGRPVIAYPATPGGFRLRYGNSRSTGTAATSLHPAIMHLTKFIAVGTQLATEYPGKATVCTPCETIEPPVVLLDTGEVRIVETKEDINKLKNSIKSIISLGDVLIPYGEFASQGKRLLPASYCEEWWVLEMEKAQKKTNSIDISRFTENRTKHNFLTFKEAQDLSKGFGIPIHPRFNYFWHDLKKEDLIELISATSKAKVTQDSIIYTDDSSKPILETLCIPHRLDGNKEGNSIVIEGDHARSLFATLGSPTSSNISNLTKSINKHKNTMDALNSISEFIIRPKGITRIGMKMGRPEKAERRMMKGRPQILFPCGEEGGRMRNIMASYKIGHVKSSFPTFFCPNCKTTVFFHYCPFCHSMTTEQRVCQKCGKQTDEKTHCGADTIRFKEIKADIRPLVDQAMKNIGMKQLPDLFKGVKGVFGADKDMEPVEKGLLRTKYDLFVNKDGTTRYDAIDVPLTHFKPKEISVSVKKLKEIGYMTDIDGKPLENDSQIVEMKSQDILLSDNSDFSGVGYFKNICNFIDELLVKFYNLKPFYNIKDKEDLVGHLVIGLAPHTSAGIIGRIVGFTPAKVCFATPFWHAAKRRNCDGDEDSILLLMDALLNFSRSYLPTTRGAATMDAPLVLTTHLDPEEVDDESWSVDVQDAYPLEFYEETADYPNPWEISTKIKLVEDFIGDPNVFHARFIHENGDINNAPYKSYYVELESMVEKINAQLNLAKSIKAVNADDVAEKVLKMHFLKDIKGNLRSFSKQNVRCVECNEKFRRVPLKGVCSKCGGKLILTIHEGSVRKYMDISKQMISDFKITTYLSQQFRILEEESDALFGKKARQMNLGNF